MNDDVERTFNAWKDYARNMQVPTLFEEWAHLIALRNAHIAACRAATPKIGPIAMVAYFEKRFPKPDLTPTES